MIFVYSFILIDSFGALEAIDFHRDVKNFISSRLLKNQIQRYEATLLLF